MRVEANISLNRAGKIRGKTPGVKRFKTPGVEERTKLGTKVEVKNLNSFRSVERAIAYEIERQSELLEAGEQVLPETRGWDEHKEVTVSQRVKETESDYRYFPEPDIPTLKSLQVTVDGLPLPELPEEKRERYKGLGINASEGEVLVDDLLRGKRFDQLAEAEPGLAPVLAQLLVHSPELAAKPDEELLKLATIPAHQRKAVLSGGEIGGELSAEALDQVITKVMKNNEKAVVDYKAGKTAALQVLIGAVMRETKGGATPQAVKEALEEKLKI